MNANVVLSLGITLICLAGCSKPEEPVRNSALQTDWGVVQEMEFLRAVKSRAYFKVKTSKVQFSEIDVTAFPGDTIKVGDHIFRQTILSKKQAEVSYCKGGLCSSVAVCFSWQPCFVEYQTMLDVKSGTTK